VPGIDCPASCTTQWDLGSRVSLEARPSTGQRFVRWSGACSGSGPCSVALQAAQSVGVLFAPARFSVVVGVSGRGRVTGAGAACATARCSRAAASYSPLRLRATPAPGWRLAGWSGGCNGRAATCTLAMTKAATARARFVRK
jgi:hypothetical protein